jgi:hypothetical protein
VASSVPVAVAQAEHSGDSAAALPRCIMAVMRQLGEAKRQAIAPDLA